MKMYSLIEIYSEQVSFHPITGRDKGGRTLMHIAILYQRANVVEFLIEQFPQLINSRDNVSK